MKNRQQLRHLMRTRSQQLSPTERLVSAKQAALHLSQHPIFLQAQHIACYCAKFPEISTNFLIDSIWQQKKICYLPVIQSASNKHLQFIRYNRDDTLQLNHFGIAEPVFSLDKLIAPLALDLVIVPLLAFDKQGNRLGTGGGYYDRTFADLLMNKLAKKPILCGFAYSLQEVDQLIAEKWDIPLQMIVTEKHCSVIEK